MKAYKFYSIYQISYKVYVEPDENPKTTPAKFQIFVNDPIEVGSSITEETITSTNLSSTQLFSLQAGDTVRLHATVPERYSYKFPALQVIQVG